ncbi:MAG: tyrosine-type recombinase/integrase, partial [Leptolyngbyaceae cyanobacterium]
MSTAPKAKKGTVSVTVDKGRLRLGWRYQGTRQFLYTGLPDTPTNRRVAEMKATQIELDIKSGHFDPSLKAYKAPQKALNKLTVVELFEQFMQHKAKRVASATLDKYRALSGTLKDFFKSRAAADITAGEVEKFIAWYDTHDLTKEVIKERLGLINACWRWGIEQECIEENPWVDMPARIKVPPKQRPRPFTREEIDAIVQAFRTNRYYGHYTSLVEFRFGTGCRTGELVGLRWKHISDDFSTIWIGEALVKGVRKATKTNRSRFITLTPKLQAILKECKKADCDPDNLVFTGPKGAPIDPKNFAQRAWTKILNELGIDYRRPYNSRHTLVSHALDQGMNPVEVAQLT